MKVRKKIQMLIENFEGRSQNFQKSSEIYGF